MVFHFFVLFYSTDTILPFGFSSARANVNASIPFVYLAFAEFSSTLYFSGILTLYFLPSCSADIETMPSVTSTCMSDFLIPGISVTSWSIFSFSSRVSSTCGSLAPSRFARLAFPHSFTRGLPSGPRSSDSRSSMDHKLALVFCLDFQRCRPC